MNQFKSKEFRVKQRNTDFIDRDLELTAVAGLTMGAETTEFIVGNFNSEYISSDLIKETFDIIDHSYTHDNIVLDKEAFKNRLNFRQAKNNKLLSIWKKISKKKKKLSHAEVVTACAKLYELYTARIVSIGLNDMAQNLKVAHEHNDISKISKVQKTLSEYTSYIESSRTLKSDKGEMIDEYDEWKKSFIEKQKNPELLRGISTGIKEIDEQMPGLRKGELGCIAGPSSGGKSIVAMHFGVNNWKMYGDSLTITIEMSKEKYMERQYCHLSGIDYSAFTRYELTRAQWNHLDRTIEKYKRNKNKNIVIDLAEGTSVKAVKREFELGMKGNNVTLGIVDYMNIMCGPNGTVGYDWETQLSIATELKLLVARGLSLPIWTPIQTDGNDGEAFSKHIKDQLDVGLTLKPDENTNETGIMNVSWFKTRDFLGRNFSLTTTRGKMRFTEVGEQEEKRLKKINKVRKRKTNV